MPLDITSKPPTLDVPSPALRMPLPRPTTAADVAREAIDAQRPALDEQADSFRLQNEEMRMRVEEMKKKAARRPTRGRIQGVKANQAPSKGVDPFAGPSLTERTTPNMKDRVASPNAERIAQSQAERTATAAAAGKIAQKGGQKIAADLARPMPDQRKSLADRTKSLAGLPGVRGPVSISSGGMKATASAGGPATFSPAAPRIAATPATDRAAVKYLGKKPGEIASAKSQQSATRVAAAPRPAVTAPSAVAMTPAAAPAIPTPQVASTPQTFRAPTPVATPSIPAPVAPAPAVAAAPAAPAAPARFAAGDDQARALFGGITKPVSPAAVTAAAGAAGNVASKAIGAPAAAIAKTVQAGGNALTEMGNRVKSFQQGGLIRPYAGTSTPAPTAATAQTPATPTYRPGLTPRAPQVAANPKIMQRRPIPTPVRSIAGPKDKRNPLLTAAR